MGVQTSVNMYAAAAVAGDRAGQEKIITLPYNCTAENDTTDESNPVKVKVGNFVWAGTNEGQVKATGSDAPLGFVVRNLDNYDFDLLSEGTQYIVENDTVTVAVEGDFYATTTTDATVGQKVFALTADGSIATGDAGGAVDGGVETNFIVKMAGSADDLIIIGTWGVR